MAMFLFGIAAAPAPAQASYPHVVTPGETLSGIAASNGVSTDSIAAFNGISADTMVIEGQTISVPDVGEGGVASSNTTSTPAAATGGHTVLAGESLSSVAAANGLDVSTLASANGLSIDAYLVEGQSLTIPATPAGVPAGLGSIPSPGGPLALDPGAADSWNAMRDDSIANYGVDLYPNGPSSAYRTTAQQQELYDAYLAGTGAPANPPGTSSHELGIAVDLADPSMRSVVDQIGAYYGWAGTIPAEWWHVAYGGG